MKTITVSHHEDALDITRMCDPSPVLTPEVRFDLTYPEGQERAALDALERAYAQLKRRITGMVTLVHGEREED